MATCLQQEVIRSLVKRYVAAMIRSAKTDEGLTEENFKVGALRWRAWTWVLFSACVCQTQQRSCDLFSNAGAAAEINEKRLKQL